MDTKSKRMLISQLWNEGNQTCSNISKTLNIPERTVYRVVSKLKAGNGIERKEGSGRPRILDTKDHRRLAQIVRAGPMKSVENIRQRMIERGSPAVSNATVNRELHRMNYTKKRAISSPLLTETHKQMRLNWCHEHQNLSWDNVIFSDECSVWSYPAQINIWTKDSVTPVYQRPKHTQKFHLWGGVSARGATPLCVFTGILTKEGYIDILEGHLLPFMQVMYPDGCTFQHDNDPKHTAHTTKAWLQEKNVTVLKWPSNSPDLNPIENVWALLKNHLKKSGLRDIEQLKKAAEKYWDSLTHNYLQTLVGSMPRRIQACLAGEGNIILY